MDFTQLISKLTELSQSSTQRFPDQVSGTEKAKAIRVLGGQQDPDHPFQGRLVGADESVDQSLSEDLIAQLTQEFADFLRDKQPVMDDVFPAAQDRDLGNKPEDRELAAEASLIQQPAQPAAKTAQPAAQQPTQPVTQQPAVKPAQPAAQQPEITNIAGRLSKLLGMDATQLKAAYQAPNPNPRQLGVLADAFKKLAAIGPVEKAKAMTLLKQISSEETGTIQELTEGWKPKNKAKHKSCQQSVKNRVSVWPSAYASAQVVQCYYGKKKRKKKISEAEEYAGKGQGMLGVKNITGYLDDGEKIPLMNLKDHYINRVPDSSALRLIEKIKSDCSNYIDILKRTKNRLYRGTKPFGNVYVGKSRTDRKPKDSDPILATELDRQMKAKGLTATRSNSIFVSSNIGHARAYGYPYLIIPKNTATFTWSKVNGDIWLSTSVHNKIDVDDFKFTQDHLETAMISGHEIMISGEYYAIYYSTPDMNFESQMITRDFIKRILGQTTGDI